MISHLFTIAFKEWGMESLTNPIEKIKMPTPAKSRDRRLDPDKDKDGLTEEDLLLD